MTERAAKPDGLKLVIGYVEFDQIDQYRHVEMLGDHEMRLEFRAPENELSQWAAAIGGRFRVTIEELAGDGRERCRVCMAGIDKICKRCGRKLDE